MLPLTELRSGFDRFHLLLDSNKKKILKKKVSVEKKRRAREGRAARWITVRFIQSKIVFSRSISKHIHKVLKKKNNFLIAQTGRRETNAEHAKKRDSTGLIQIEIKFSRRMKKHLAHDIKIFQKPRFKMAGLRERLIRYLDSG